MLEQQMLQVLSHYQQELKWLCLVIMLKSLLSLSLLSHLKKEQDSLSVRVVEQLVQAL